ncbi:tetratricopeptide repeat protein [uncultured Thiohalocapsa sp.]|uniref:tetratricopeptide repeat protein n=1 Tax=uncultured Thiohalocapsa sp. TaxID=768990 RepID=UPI0025F52871|nr:tetratricopeptide repeat protein [uncultured Thiohalocapsa sp.]
MTPYARIAVLWLSVSLPALAVADNLVADASAPPPAAAAGTAAATQADGDAPPALTADLIYSVLVGEVAAQRSDQETAFIHYLEAARLARDPALAALAARAALALGDPQAGERAVDLWQALDPESLKARQIAAYVQIEAQSRAGTLAALRELVRLTPADQQPYMQVAQLLARVEDAAQRLDLMQVLIVDAADNADAQFALATLAAAADDDTLARAAAQRAAELRPGWAEPRVFQVQLLVTAGERRAAAELLDGFLADTERHAKELMLLRAQLYIDADEYEPALALFDSLLADDPAQPDVLFTAAVLALEVDALEQARRYLTRLDELGRRGDDVAFLFGQLEERAGNTDAALGWYAKVDGPNATDAAVRIARLHAAAGDLSRARDKLQQLRDRLPDDTATLYLIEGELLRQHDAEQQALTIYDQALAAQPDNSDLRYARAMTAVGLDRLELLESDLRHIIAQDPEHADALNALGYTLADRTNRLTEAHALIERALALNPDEPAIKDSMGWVLYRMGQPAAAEPYLRDALESAFDPEIAAHLGEVLWALGRQDEARAIWDRALEADPDHEYLLRVLGKHRYSQTPD